MSEEYNADEASEMEQSTPINRRRLLKTMGVAGGSITFGSAAIGPASASERKEVERLRENLTIEALSSQTKREKVNQAMNNPDVEQINTQFTDRGWTPNLSESKALRSVYDSENNSNNMTYYTVIVPFKKPTGDNDYETFIRWSSLSDIEPMGYDIQKSSGTPSIQSDYGVPDAEFTTYRTENGAIKTHTGETPEGTSTESPTPQMVCAPTVVCTGSFDFGCVSAVAAGAAGGSPTCQTCVVDPTKISCIACAGVLYGAGYSLTQCCNNGSVKCTRCCL